MVELVVLADDRTGALETAGLIADAGWGRVPVVVAPDCMPEGAVIGVVDIGSRRLPAEEAVARALAVAASSPARRSAHKIDSTLRGNWADEVVARQVAGRSRALVVPAFPAVGRTCVGGVVHVDGAPLASRPADLLAAAGAVSVAVLRGAHDVAAWVSEEASARVAVCDATTSADLAAVGRAWAQLDDVLLAGSAGAIGAGAAALVSATTVDRVDSVTPSVEASVLVVCGSLHPVARSQVDALRDEVAATVLTTDDDHAALLGSLRSGGVGVLCTEVVPTPTARGADAERAVAGLAAAVRRVMDAVEIGTLVVVGGDTAAAVLGSDPVVVGGTLGPGIPWARRPTATSTAIGGPLIVTKAGGFGDDLTLVRLLPGRMDG